MKEVEMVQGDVFFVATSGIPKGAKKVSRTSRGLVLAEGEATGHCHVIQDTGAELFRNENGDLYLQVDGETVSLKHEEHKPVTIPKGTWKVGQVVEYDPFDEEVRKVQD